MRMRTNGFVILFLTLQSLLAFIILIASSIGNSNAGDVISAIVLFLYCFALLVIQPLRGISALSSEISGQTIDLMVLTKLSAWRIVWGKWVSIISQSFLILITIIPYLIFRYFFGGMQLFAELMLFISLFLLSCSLTAIMIGISGVGTPLFRGLMAIISPIFFFFLIVRMMEDRFLEPAINMLTFSQASSIWAFLGLFAALAYITYFFLELGAKQIAPLAENRSTLKRMVSTVFFLFGSILLWLLNDITSSNAFAVFFLALLSTDLLSENPNFPAKICRPFLRFGSLGRIAGRFYYPGWASGTLLLLSLILCQLGINGIDYARNQNLDAFMNQLILCCSLFAIILFPAALIRLFFKSKSSLPTIILIHLISFTLLLISNVLERSTSEESIYWILGSLIPHIQLPLLSNTFKSYNETLFFITAITFTIYSIITLTAAFKKIKETTKTEKEELNRLSSPTEAA